MDNKDFKCKPGCPYAMLYEDMLLREQHFIEVIEDLLDLNLIALDVKTRMIAKVNGIKTKE